MANEGQRSFDAIIIRSSTPPASEKVGFWFQGFQESPPGKPPSSHNSEFDGPALDPAKWKPPPPMGSYRQATPKIVGSPARSNATARLNDELNEHPPSVPDYIAAVEREERRSTTHNAPRSVAASSVHNPPPSDHRHFSYESWGNLGAPRESTFGPMIIKPGESRKPGETPAFAAGIPLPPMSEFGASSFRGPSFHQSSGHTPSVVPITVETPSEPQSDRHSYAPSHRSHAGTVANGGGPSQSEQRVDHKTESHVSHSRAPSTTKAPSIAPSHKASERSRAFSPERMLSPRSQASRPPTHYSHSSVKPEPVVPFSIAQLQEIHERSPSKAPSRAAPSERAPTENAMKRSSFAGSVRRSIYKEPSHRSPSRARNATVLDDDSLMTERSAIPPGGGSTYSRSRRGGTESRMSQISHKSDVPLHPLTVHARSVASTHRPVSPYGEPMAEDIMHAAIRGRAVAPPFSHVYQPSLLSQTGMHHRADADITPTPSRPQSPEALNEYEQGLVDDALTRTPRTSYTITPSALAAEVHDSQHHDNELCLLLHAADDPGSHDVVRRAVRKAIKARLKKLGLQHDNEAVNTYRNAHSNLHRQAPVVVHMQQPDDVPPAWARDMMDLLQSTQARVDHLDHKLSAKGSLIDEYPAPSLHSEMKNYDHPGMDLGASEGQLTPDTVTIPIHTAYNGTHAEESMYPGGGDTEIATVRAVSTHGPTVPGSIHHHDGSLHLNHEDADLSDGAESHHYRRGSQYTPPHQDTEHNSEIVPDTGRPPRNNSPGLQRLEEEFYKLKMKSAKSEHSHHTWEIARDDEDGNERASMLQSDSDAMPEIPDADLPVSASGYAEQLERRVTSPPLPALPLAQNGHVSQPWEHEWRPESDTPPPWQRIHQRLLNWAIVWPMSELDQSLNSTLRGHQVNEVALSIWATQTYKRYVRTRMMDHPRQTVDRLFVPPNMADAINNAVFNGRHGDACGMLRDLWNPFGLEGMPRLLVVLARHRKDQNHWVVHRFSLPDGGLTTYDSFPERALPDGRPLGWWFAIRIAWPHAMYPSPDHLVQKIVRLHRPLQLLIDNSVAAAGVWRNILMGSRAERSLDLERLRDLINTEVKNLRQRKDMGKLSISAPKPNWEEITGA